MLAILVHIETVTFDFKLARYPLKVKQRGIDTKLFPDLVPHHYID